MKKLAAIFLLLIFLFNLFGYRIWVSYQMHQASAQLTASLDKHEYNEAELITIRIPLSMPYQIVQSNFERVDGEINISGKIYRYVKRKIDNGELVLQCLPDKSKMRIQSAGNDYFKNSNDIATNDASKKSDNSKTSFFKNSMSDYDRHAADIYTINFIKVLGGSSVLYQCVQLLSMPHKPPVPPPDFI